MSFARWTWPWRASRLTYLVHRLTPLRGANPICAMYQVRGVREPRWIAAIRFRDQFQVRGVRERRWFAAIPFRDRLQIRAARLEA